MRERRERDDWRIDEAPGGVDGTAPPPGTGQGRHPGQPASDPDDEESTEDESSGAEGGVT